MSKTDKGKGGTAVDDLEEEARDVEDQVGDETDETDGDDKGEAETEETADDPDKGAEDTEGDGDAADEGEADDKDDESEDGEGEFVTRADLEEERASIRQEIIEEMRAEALAAASSQGKVLSEDEEAQLLEQEYVKELAKIPKDDPDRNAKVYAAIAKVNVRYGRQIKEQAVKESEGKIAAASKPNKAVLQANADAKIALEEIGLDPEKYFPMFQKEVNLQLKKNNRWFTVVPPEQQYMRLAERVLQRVETNKSANDTHRKQAGGQLEGGASGKSVKRGIRDTDERDEGDTMVSAMKVAQKGRQTLGTKLYQMGRGPAR